MAVTSEDDGQKFGLPAPVDAALRAADMLRGIKVLAVRLQGGTADIRLDFADDFRLDVIPSSSGYESWQISAPGGHWLVAQGGGQICHWYD